MIYLLLIKHSDMKHCFVRLFFKTRSWDSSGGITGRGLNPGKGKIFSSPVSRPALRPNQPPIQWVLGALSTGIKQPGHEAHQSPSFSTEVKNGRAIPLIPHVLMA
jgi:hypothetical protein